MRSSESAQAQAKIGRLVKNRWRIDALLGMGGMAWVYAATHKNLHRVALKMLLPALSQNQSVRDRFLREGYVSNAVGHPNAVRVFDDDVDEDGTAFLVMELFEGADLDALRRARGGRIDVATALHIASIVLDVLAAAHERRIIHRDIKPSNVFITHDRAIKLLDFGIARLREEQAPTESTASGAVLGSFAYMAPEQARAHWNRIDGRTDLWALGATLFRVLSGEHVHPAPNANAQLARAGSDEARSLASAAPDLPEVVVALVDRALAFEPEGRFDSAAEMLDAVRRAQEELGLGEPNLDVEASAAQASSLPRPVSLGSAGASSEAPTRVEPLGRERVLDEDTRARALEKLERFGIRGKDVHFIDTVPLLEMIWADGHVQEQERLLLDGFLKAHVQNINELAGDERVTIDDARAFVSRFLGERPSDELLGTLRALMVQLRLDTATPSERHARRRAVLDFCLDIGAACVAAQPQGDHERFCREEKDAFDRILRALGA